MSLPRSAQSPRRSFFYRLAALVAVGPLARFAPPLVVQPRELIGVDFTWSQDERLTTILSTAKSAQEDYDRLMGVPVDNFEFASGERWSDAARAAYRNRLDD